MNATTGVGVNRQQVEASIYDVLTRQLSPADAVIPLPGGACWHLLPSSAALVGADMELMRHPRREFRLREALAKIGGQYDFVLLDCPPALTLITLNALVASDAVIIPLQCEYYALEGLTSLLDTINHINKNFNNRLEIEGIVRTMYDARNTLTLDVSEQLTKHFGEKLYQTVIPRNVRLAEAPSHGLPVYRYDRYSKGALAYMQMASEFLKHQRLYTPGVRNDKDENEEE